MTQRRSPGGQGPARGGHGTRPTRRAGSPARSARGARTALRDASIVREPRPTETGRSASRPAAARRAAAAGAAKRTTATQPRRYTGRAAVLIVVLIALALAYTYPVRLYLSQEADIAAMEAAQAEQRERIRQLTELRDKWQDDEYVRTQVRNRFYYAHPDETLLIVMNQDADAAPGTVGIPSAPSETPDKWYDTLWSSIQEANK
ncbi:cell division protein FtsB [Catenuloplanes nepalensis]|uniref:Cell division protein FtsB n=1 Tax=Catenuloplanes nepalensis TaxID=587533 RepID=A0ABT9N6H9_9ACTN|nr:septum formation initiator family protein [Catenuloplanes nepalensis]MDP9799302.1 cell division protein FtsB [Catenuloplanes nepalensis]